MVEKENILSLDVVKSLQYVEGWAKVKWHRIHGGLGFPAGENNEVSSSFRRGSPSNMPGLFDAFITVEERLEKLQSPWLLIAFLLWCYPKEGTYEREGSYEDFRPQELVQIAQKRDWNEEQITDFLKKIEHKFFCFISKKI